MQKYGPSFCTFQFSILNFQFDANAALLLRRLFAVPHVDHAGLAFPFFLAARKLPAGLALVGERGAGRAPLIRTILDLPARRVVEELFDPLDADLLGMDQLPYAPAPFDVVLRVQPVPALTGRQYQAVLLIEPQGLRSGPPKPRGHAHRIERRVLVFPDIRIFRYHKSFIFSPIIIAYDVIIVILFVIRSRPIAIRITPLVTLMALKCSFTFLNEDRNALMATAERIKGRPRPREENTRG